MTAPLLQSAPRTVNARRHAEIGTVYRSWATHYNACPTCQRDHWFSPLADEPFFCPSGQGLFRAWVSVAHITPVAVTTHGW